MIESGEMGKVKWGIATKRMAWPQCVERKGCWEVGVRFRSKQKNPKTPRARYQISFNSLGLKRLSLVAVNDLTINNAKILSSFFFRYFLTPSLWRPGLSLYKREKASWSKENKRTLVRWSWECPWCWDSRDHPCDCTLQQTGRRTICHQSPSPSAWCRCAWTSSGFE